MTSTRASMPPRGCTRGGPAVTKKNLDAKTAPAPSARVRNPRVNRKGVARVAPLSPEPVQEQVAMQLDNSDEKSGTEILKAATTNVST